MFTFLEMQQTESKQCKLFSSLSLGNSYCIQEEKIGGYCWSYDTEDFTIDIHDYLIYQDILSPTLSVQDKQRTLSATYLLSACGEWLDPYQKMSPNSLMLLASHNNCRRFVLHGGYPFKAITIQIKNKLYDDLLLHRQSQIIELNDIYNNEEELSSIGDIAKQMIHCEMDAFSTKLFLEAKVKEWISITFDTFQKKESLSQLPDDDREAIILVANYVDDHFAKELSQKFLANLACMSPTSLKVKFKNHFGMNLTEYIQRQRMNVAENLLLNSQLTIEHIAEAVGYKSHSRFSCLFKRYKGVSPSDFRLSLVEKQKLSPCHDCPFQCIHRK